MTFSWSLKLFKSTSCDIFAFDANSLFLKISNSINSIVIGSVKMSPLVNIALGYMPSEFCSVTHEQAAVQWHRD